MCVSMLSLIIVFLMMMMVMMMGVDLLLVIFMGFHPIFVRNNGPPNKHHWIVE
jgi:hypothetical protein